MVNYVQPESGLLVRELDEKDDSVLQKLFDHCHKDAEISFGLPFGTQKAHNQLCEGCPTSPRTM